MDWDDVRPKPKPAAVLGEDLSKLSVDDLATRLSALQSEVARVETEIAARRAHEVAAAALFKS